VEYIVKSPKFVLHVFQYYYLNIKILKFYTFEPFIHWTKNFKTSKILKFQKFQNTMYFKISKIFKKFQNSKIKNNKNLMFQIFKNVKTEANGRMQ
jgi:GTP cyclohydrolase III